MKFIICQGIPYCFSPLCQDNGTREKSTKSFINLLISHIQPALLFPVYPNKGEDVLPHTADVDVP